ncbi:MAG: hypothetical protein HN337_08985 [Deltaproteobacteria bacterium]|jgi:hypothetical protein|nr:hypothetical protein [Deltaproteobacteria bacterium]
MKALKIVLILFVAASIGYLVANEYSESSRSESDTSPQNQILEGLDGVIVYYFHGNKRCTTCNTIEEYSRESISPFIDRKEIKWRTINIDSPENRHFIDEFRLKNSGPVIVEYDKKKVNRWHSLDKVWQLVRNKNNFDKYINEEISQFLKSGNDG